MPLIAREPFSGSDSYTSPKFKTKYESLVIFNTGSSNLTFTINDRTWTVPAGYAFDETVDPFDQIVVNGSSFSGYVREEDR
jgi:hypothetical protein